MKKVLLLVLVNLVLLSCSYENDLEIESTNPKNQSTSRLAAGQNVKLIRAKDSRSFGCSIGGCFTNQSRNYLVEVSNLAFNKTVIVHQELANGQWEDFALNYKFTTSTGTEIWEGNSYKSSSSYSPTPVILHGEKVAVKYEVNGQTYWDNNYGNNYVVANASYSSSTFTFLNQDFNIFKSNASLYAIYNSYSSISITADIRNLGFAKDVKIVYTLDNWATTNTYSLNYVQASPYSYSFPADIEQWSATFTIPLTNEVKYALSYKVNGVTYWDNNFGQNYVLNYSNSN